MFLWKKSKLLKLLLSLLSLEIILIVNLYIQQDCLLQGQAQMDQRVIFCFCTLKLRSKKEYF